MIQPILTPEGNNIDHTEHNIQTIHAQLCERELVCLSGRKENL